MKNDASREPEAGVAELKTLFGCIDNTTLHGNDTHETVRKLCEESLCMIDELRGIPPVAAVCVYPTYVRYAASLLKGSGIKVAAVAGGFPSAHMKLEVKRYEVEQALADGADEIDTVFNRAALLEGDSTKAYDEVATLKECCGQRTLKVILETGDLPTTQHIEQAAALAIEGGADFIKTSTGKTAVGATPQAAQAMLKAIEKAYEKEKKQVGFKAAGGIATLDDALTYFRLARQTMGKRALSNQNFRIGSSRLTRLLFEHLTRQVTSI